jgi:hypothetical protein
MSFLIEGALLAQNEMFSSKGRRGTPTEAQEAEGSLRSAYAHCTRLRKHRGSLGSLRTLR